MYIVGRLASTVKVALSSLKARESDLPSGSLTLTICQWFRRVNVELNTLLERTRSESYKAYQRELQYLLDLVNEYDQHDIDGLLEDAVETDELEELQDLLDQLPKRTPKNTTGTSTDKTTETTADKNTDKTTGKGKQQSGGS
ncbi:MAG: hypothetical protein M1816_005138 [Peltula sp. TS41687]|nr:MAG: hypothetical protein M1816_005138 [Peltula sp. TS41687]